MSFTSARKRVIPTLSLIAGILMLSGCGRTAVNKTHGPVPKVEKPLYNYKPLMGFQPLLPTHNFQLQQISAYVFKFVNPPWGNVNPQVIETWGNDTAFDAMYIAPNGSGKSFTIMETKTNENGPPNIGSPWRTVHKQGKTFFENQIPGYGTGVAMMNKGVLYLVTSYASSTNGFKITQLEQILKSLSTPVRYAPDMIKAQTFGFAKAPTAVPFIPLLPKTIPFTWNTRTAVGENVTSYGVKKEYQHMGRLTLVYEHGKTDLKVFESLGMKYVNPNVSKAENGVDVTLNDGQKAVYIDGGSAVSFVDGGSPNRRVITWTINSGVNITMVGSEDLTENDLLTIANSLQKAHDLHTTPLYTHKGQFNTPSVTRPQWMKFISTKDIKGLSFAKSPGIGYPNLKTNRLVSELVAVIENGRVFKAGNVAYPGSTWQITIWLKNGQAVGITPILRGELRTRPMPPTALGPGPGPFDYPPHHNQYAIVYLRTPSTISNGANWVLDKRRGNQVVFFQDPSLSIRKIVAQHWG